MSNSFDTLINIMALLRGPGGCPWDHEQTHLSILPQLIEETYELVEAIESENDEHFCEELGDLLLHVVFHAQMARDRKKFDIENVINGLCEKLVRRHPHVFSDQQADTASEVSANWEQIKSTEKKTHAVKSYLDAVPKSFPALLQSYKISKRASKVGFDWKKKEQVFEKIEEEIAELKAAIAQKNKEEIEHEVGDLLFSMSSLARKYDIDPEEALRKANQRFRKRFLVMEKHIDNSGTKMQDIAPTQWEEMWQQAKRKLAKQNQKS